MNGWVKTEAKNLAVMLLILVAFLVALRSGIQQLKNEINGVTRQQCVANQSGAIIAKYNDSIDVQVGRMAVSAQLDAKRGDKVKAANDNSAMAQLNADKVVLPKADCSKPLLP